MLCTILRSFSMSPYSFIIFFKFSSLVWNSFKIISTL